MNQEDFVPVGEGYGERALVGDRPSLFDVASKPE